MQQRHRERWIPAQASTDAPEASSGSTTTAGGRPHTVLLVHYPSHPFLLVFGGLVDCLID